MKAKKILMNLKPRLKKPLVTETLPAVRLLGKSAAEPRTRGFVSRWEKTFERVCQQVGGNDEIMIVMSNLKYHQEI